MDIETTNALLATASSLTTNAVLMLWLWREMKRSDKAQLRLEQFHDREREERMARAKELEKGA